MLTNIVMASNFFGAIGSFFNALMQPLYWAISAVMIAWHTLFSTFMDPNAGLTWVLVIVGLIVIVRSALVPLFIKSMMSTRATTAVQPKMKELQKKYAGDQQRLGQETMKLYKEEGINPAAGCLPMLVQIPVMWALFTVMNGAARGNPEGMFRRHPELMHSLRNADFMGAKLSATFLPMDHGFGGTQIFTSLMVLALVVTMFYTQWQMMHKNMSPEALTGSMAQQQKMMMYIFPLSYFFFGWTIPLGVLIYWVMGNIWTMIQQSLFIRNLPAPNTPAYVDWEERMRAKGLDPRQIERDREAKRKAKKGIVAVPAAADGGAPRVARQDLSGKNARPVVRRQSAPATVAGKAKGAEETTAAENEKIVVRQQPRKQARSVRRKG